MTRYSYSRVDLYRRCPYHFKIRYIDKLTELPDLTNAANPLIIGSALHKGIEEESVQAALDYYEQSFPRFTTEMVDEMIKLEYWIPRAIEFLKERFEGERVRHEYKILTDNFIGFVDLIVYHDDGTQTIVDFKYSNSIKNYKESGQMSIYQHELEKQGFNIRDLYYLFVPKATIEQEHKESTFQFRKRLNRMLDDLQLSFVKMEYDQQKVDEFHELVDQIENHTGEYERNKHEFCFACHNEKKTIYLDAIQNIKGEILMALPVNTRREKKIDVSPDFWIYADSYVGKSTFVDQVEDVLFFNTDGNTDNTTAPFIPLADTPVKKGRRTEMQYGWETFEKSITDLATEENTYKAVAIDLVEDLYELCRTYVFDKNDWEHESDGDWGKGWSMVQTTYNNAIKRLKMLGYQIIYISKEKVESVKLKGGNTVDHFSPNIGDKHANFLSGTVDLTMRAYVDTDGIHKLQLVKDKDSFGGSRIAFKTDVINLNYDEFLDELVRAQKGFKTYEDDKVTEVEEKPKSSRRRKKVEEPEEVDEVEEDEELEDEEIEDAEVEESADDLEEIDEPEEEEEEEPKRKTRKRRSRKTEEEEEEEESDEEVEEKPTRRRRRRRSRG